MHLLAVIHKYSKVIKGAKARDNQLSEDVHSNKNNVKLAKLIKNG